MKRSFLLCMSMCALFLNLSCRSFPKEEMMALQRGLRDGQQYIVIDISDGKNAEFYPITTLSDVPIDGWGNEYKTDKLVLRRIEAGSFMMGSPIDELERWLTEDLHKVTLTEPYYIGVFEVTQEQWELVMGDNPSIFEGDERPVESVSYDMIRGTSRGTKWPISTTVDGASFMGKLRAKTMLNFDLPTEAEWEYACRAGTTTAYNSGRDPTGSSFACANLAEVSRYRDNWLDRKGGYVANHTTVGSYLPNAWGLYDMHGNVFEWCLDWSESSLGTTMVTDPVGPTTGTIRLLRGGSWKFAVQGCRSAYRYGGYPYRKRNENGLRVAIHVEQVK